MGKRDRFTDGRESTAPGIAAGFNGHGVSATCLAGTAADSFGQDTDVCTGGARTGAAERQPRRGSGLRNESGVDRGAMPSRDSRRWESGGLSVGY